MNVEHWPPMWRICISVILLTCTIKLIQWMFFQ